MSGVLECGVLECWSVGVLECWSVGVSGVLECPSPQVPDLIVRIARNIVGV